MGSTRNSSSSNRQLSDLAAIFHTGNKALIAAKRRKLVQAGRRNGWNVEQTAEHLHYDRRTFYRWLAAYELLDRFASEREKIKVRESRNRNKLAA